MPSFRELVACPLAACEAGYTDSPADASGDSLVGTAFVVRGIEVVGGTREGYLRTPVLAVRATFDTEPPIMTIRHVVLTNSSCKVLIS